MNWRTVILSFALCMLGGPATRGDARVDINCATDIAGCCCNGARGNVDCDIDDAVDISDLTLLIDHLFIGLQPLPSFDEANVDGEGQIDIGDVTRLIDRLFISLSPLLPCPGILNHPPETRILGFDSTVYQVNAVVPSSPGAGLRFSWTGSDIVDHPYEPKPLRYEWRLYGPYDSITFASLQTRFRKVVFRTNAGEILRRGEGNLLVKCDTVYMSDPPATVITCDTLFVDTVTVANIFGRPDTLLDVDDVMFMNDPNLNKVAVSSSDNGSTTTSDTRDSLFDVFRYEPHATTIERDFVFWVRAVDNDSPPKFDPTPPHVHLKVIDPKFERDVLIADAGRTYEVNARNLAKAILYWGGALGRWRPSATYDYCIVPQSSGISLPLALVLQHKVTIVVSDDVIQGVIPQVNKSIIAATSAGASIWMCGRTLLAGNENQPPTSHTGGQIYPLGPWMGLSKYFSTGWDWYALKDPSVRIEDFKGANPLMLQWPTLAVDSSYLHSRYGWGGSFFPWVDSLAALPEVTAFDPTPSAQILYNYKSLFAGHHPILADSVFLADKPVVYRLDRGYFRLFVSAFTPYSLAGDYSGGAAQVFIDSALNWLTGTFTGTTPVPAPDRDVQVGEHAPGTLEPFEVEEVKR